MINQEFEAKWKNVLEEISSIVTSLAFNTFFKELSFKRIDEVKKIIYLSAGNEMTVDIVTDRYKQLTENAIEQVFGNKYKISVEVEQEQELIPNGNPKDHSEVFTDENWLNPKYTFENFVVGENNKFAHAAAVAVAENPGKSYNPLFIYGGSGLGKTHLMHSIGCYILKNTNFKKKVLFVSSEMFVNDLIDAIGSGTMRSNSAKTNAFRKKYRGIDVLLIDDIQFLEKKEQCQIEFFNTFNDLISKKKQIIISSDRPPTDLKTFDERLKSRLSSNMVVDLIPPDLETRIAILLKYANNLNLNIDNDLNEVIAMIAEKFPNNIRELEGAFQRVIAFSNMIPGDPIPITPKFARYALKEIFVEQDSAVTPINIKKKVCKYFNIKMEDLESPKRSRNIAYPRQIAMYLCREMTDMSLPKIGEFFGGRDHTTVLHACDKIAGEISSQDETYKIVNDIKAELTV